MSLYGALFSGVSGLNAQSTDLSIISDNISNVNTVGYKGGSALFQTLVTGISSGTTYSPGGVIGGDRATVDQQGLLQSTNSPTDIGVQGDGLFVVNQKADGSGSMLYTRAGSFTQDSSGNFVNAAGFYLQAWPLNANGALPGAPGNADTTSSANLTSLQTVNVQNLTGAASPTTTVTLAANLNAGINPSPGSKVTAGLDQLDLPNVGIDANTIIAGEPINSTQPDSLTPGDAFTVNAGTGPVTYTYGGYTYSRSVISPSVLGASGTTLQAPTQNIGTTVENLAAGDITSEAAGTHTAVITSTANGLANGDYVTLTGPVGGAGGLTQGDLTGTFEVTVIDADHYRITTVGTSTGAAPSTATATAAVNPLSVTTGSGTITVFQPAHGLVSGDVVSLSGDTATVGNIPPSDINGKFVVNVVDANHYTITALNNVTANANTGGGSDPIIVTMRPFAGDILDAQTPTDPFLGITGVSNFTNAALSFTATLNGITSTFTYTPSSPDAALGQFNNLDNLATAISDVNGLTARVVNNQLLVSAVDSSNAVTFANGSTQGVAGPPVQAGIDWVGELGLTDVSAGINRFDTLQGLSDLVNNTPGLVSTVNNPEGQSSITIGMTSPLTQMTIADRPVQLPMAPLAAGSTFQTTAGSTAVVVSSNAPLPTGFGQGDIVNLNWGGGAVDGIPQADLNGQFVISNVTPTGFTINVPTADEPLITGGTASAQNLIITPPTNTGSVVAALGLDTSLGGSPFTSTTQESVGPIGPAYVPLDSTKNMASGSITPQFSRPVTVYDSLGTAHNLNIGFIKTGQNQWAVEVYAQPASDVNSIDPNGIVAYGTVSFNGDGSLRSVDNTLDNANINWTNGAAPSTVAFDWGTAGPELGTPGASVIGLTNGLEQFDSAFNVSEANQNGSAVGSLTAISIGTTGLITASFSNGETKNLYQIPLASFTAPDQLQALSGNVYAQSAGSGEVALDQAGSNPVGTISSSSLEASNVELASQLTSMIVAQSAYQANTKVISTANTLLSDLDQIIQ